MSEYIAKNVPIVLARNEADIPEGVFRVKMVGDIYGVIAYLTLTENGNGMIRATTENLCYSIADYKVALANTAKYLRPQVITVKNMLSFLFDGEDDYADVLDSDVETLKDGLMHSPFLSLSNNIHHFGATSIFLPGVAEKISQVFDNEDYYIIFMSSTQAMCQRITGPEIEEFARESIEEIADQDDALSKELYMYSAARNRIEVVPRKNN